MLVRAPNKGHNEFASIGKQDRCVLRVVTRTGQKCLTSVRYCGQGEGSAGAGAVAGDRRRRTELCPDEKGQLDEQQDTE